MWPPHLRRRGAPHRHEMPLRSASHEKQPWGSRGALLVARAAPTGRHRRHVVVDDWI